MTATRWTATVQLAVAVVLLAPGQASAQLQIAPQIGVYIPHGSLIKEGSPSNPSTHFEKRPEGSLLIGVRGLYWVAKRFGVVAGVSYSPSPVAVTDSLGTTDQSGAVLFAHGQVLAVLTSDQAPWQLHVGLGGGIVSRIGGQWQYASGATAPAFVVSAGVGTPLSWSFIKPSPQQRVTVLRVELSDYISRVQFDQGLPTQTTALTHHDFTVSAMFCIPVGR